ncbi:hypothetical protein VP01_6390g1, partial [Puccinia sorghi]
GEDYGNGGLIFCFPAPPQSIFQSEEKMLSSIKLFDWENGYVIVICLLDKDKSIIFKCDQGGKKEDNKRKGNHTYKFSRLIRGPFSAHATCDRGGKTWYYQTNYPHHNHPLSKILNLMLKTAVSPQLSTPK